MDATTCALELLDCLERDDLAGLQTGLQALRAAQLLLRRDGLELVARAVALERTLALRALLRCGASDQPFELFGVYSYELLTRLADGCLEGGRMCVLLELLVHGAVLRALGHDESLVERVAAAAIGEFALDDDSVIAIARACGINRGDFLVCALRAGRPTLVQGLAATCTSDQAYGARRLGEAPLIAAAQVGTISALRVLIAAGAKPSVALRGAGYPLHFALRCELVSAAERAELVHELLRLGAVPELRDADGLDAYALAAARHDREALAVLREHGLSYGPRQSREARAKGVRDLCLIYDKADGLIYRIGQPDIPFLVGGDYDGPFPSTIGQFGSDLALVQQRRDVSFDWFRPFLRMLEHGQEFAYKDLIAKAPHIRLVRFDQSSNWSQMVD